MKEKSTFTAEQLYNANRVTITRGNIVTDLHINGYCYKYPEYSFWMKVFDLGSQYGIQNGRISKLGVKDKYGHTILHYDRGWVPGSHPKTWKHNAILHEIVQSFPEIETRQERNAREQAGKRLNAALGASGLHQMDMQFNHESGIYEHREPSNPMGFFERKNDLER